MKKELIHYDVIQKDGGTYSSRLFTVNDFVQIIQKSFMSYAQFQTAIRDLEPNIKQVFANDCLAIYENDQTQVVSASAKIFNNEINLKDIIPHVPLFRSKVLNYNNYENDKVAKPLFDFYFNKESNLLLNPGVNEDVISHRNDRMPKGLLIIRCYNYRTFKKTAVPDYVDINTKVHSQIGLYDTQLRAMPPFLDEWLNIRLDLVKTNSVYLMSPLLHHCVKIYDKLSLMAKNKKSYLRPSLIRNSINASFNDMRIVSKMNDRYKSVNNAFIRIVPCIRKAKANDPETIITISRFFNPLLRKKNAYSYADVVTNGSGTDSENEIKLDDYISTITNLDLFDILFTKEENTSSGLFCWANPELKKIADADGCSIKTDLNVLNNHMIKIDHKNNEYKTALYGEVTLQDFITMGAAKTFKMTKKFNPRLKLANGLSFLYDNIDDEEIKYDVLLKKVGYDHSFLRNINYMNRSDVTNKDINNYSRNALVAFINSNIELPAINDILKMSVEELNDFFYSLRGVSCGGAFTSSFLSQLMIVPRTEHLLFSIEDATPEFQALYKNCSINHGRIDETFKNRYYDKDNKKQFLAREYYECECGGKIIHETCRSCNTPTIKTGELISDYWADVSRDFKYVIIKDILMTEDSIDVKLEYSMTLDNARFSCDLLSKLVAVQTAQDYIGYINELNLGDISLNNVSIPLDGAYFGLGGFKSKEHGIPFAVLRLYNAMSKTVKFDSDDCLDNTNLVNSFLKDFKKSIITTKMYNAETKSYESKKIEAWVGMVSLVPTEVSQEFSKTRLENDKNLSKANYGLNSLLGFNDLNNAYAKMNIESISKSVEYQREKELARITLIYNSASFDDKTIKFREELSFEQSELIKDVKDLTNKFKSYPKLFDTESFEKMSFKQYITNHDYKKLISTHPFMIDPIFENGFYITCKLDNDTSIFNKTKDTTDVDVKRVLYFPKREILMNMFELIGDNNVRLSDTLMAFFGLFESLSVCNLHHDLSLVSKSNSRDRISYEKTIAHIQNAVKGELFEKHGLVNQITNIAVPRMMSKQLDAIDCPWDVLIQSDNYQYRKMVDKILKARYPERSQEEFNKGWAIPDENNSEPGWCWLETVYCQATHQPILFLGQNNNVKEVWSVYKANIEYLKNPKNNGKSFSDLHPYSKGIFLNSVFIVLILEGDVDGDMIFATIPVSPIVQNELSKVFEMTKQLQYWNLDNINEIPKLFRNVNAVASIDYLLKESENLNFKLDVLKIGYSSIKFDTALIANFQASRDKVNVGPLTTSSWSMNLFLDFYISNYEYFKERYKVAPLTFEDRFKISFVFQYLIAQQNGVRAMKDDGSYGELTYDNLVCNTLLLDDKSNKNSSSSFARDLLVELIQDYQKNCKNAGIELDLLTSFEKLFVLFDKLFISSGPSHGFGFAINPDTGKVFSYKKSEWSNDSTTAKGKMDCTSSLLVDPYFLDFEASFILVNGRSYETFIAKFGYDSFLKLLSYKRKKHLSNPLLSYYSDIFTK